MSTAGSPRHPRRRRPCWPTLGFTLVEIMIVVAIIGMLAVLSAPMALRARTRANTQVCIENLRQVSSAKEQFAFDSNAAHEFVPVISDLQPYVKAEHTFFCPAGGEPLVIGDINTEPRCEFHGHQAGGQDLPPIAE